MATTQRRAKHGNDYEQAVDLQPVEVAPADLWHLEWVVVEWGGGTILCRVIANPCFKFARIDAALHSSDPTHPFRCDASELLQSPRGTKPNVRFYQPWTVYERLSDWAQKQLRNLAGGGVVRNGRRAVRG